MTTAKNKNSAPAPEPEPTPPVLSLDDLLGTPGETNDNPPAPNSVTITSDPASLAVNTAGNTTSTAAVETPAQKRIRELQEELAKPAPVVDSPEPFKPSSQLTEEERQIRDLEDALAKKKAAESEMIPTKFEKPTSGNTLLIHFLADGLTFGNQVWYRGQEVEFEIDGTAYNQTKDRQGFSWLSLVDDPGAQMRRWGEQKFARGPWPFTRWEEAVATLTDPVEVQEAQAAAEAERRRGRAAPII